jgi:hypothetical protein
MGPLMAVHGAEISGLKTSVDSVKSSIDRIQWATITALGALVMACSAMIFKLLHP